MQTHARTNTRKHSQTYTNAHIYHTCMYSHTRTHTSSHTYTHTHTHALTQAHKSTRTYAHGEPHRYVRMRNFHFKIPLTVTSSSVLSRLCRTNLIVKCDLPGLRFFSTCSAVTLPPCLLCLFSMSRVSIDFVNKKKTYFFFKKLYNRSTHLSRDDPKHAVATAASRKRPWHRIITPFIRATCPPCQWRRSNCPTRLTGVNQSHPVFLSSYHLDTSVCPVWHITG